MPIVSGQACERTHARDQVATSPAGTIGSCCQSLGFGVRFPPVDHCYPPMHIWYRQAGNISDDPGTTSKSIVLSIVLSIVQLFYTRLYFQRACVHHWVLPYVNAAACIQRNSRVGVA